jgi:hypothetical protein
MGTTAMFFDVSDIIRKRAKSAHELYLINILFFHLLLTPASIALDIGYYGLLLPLLFSAMVISYIYLKGRRIDDWFVMVHWKLSYRRCRLLLIGYALSLAIFLVGFLIALGIEKESMQNIMMTVFTRIAIMPTLIVVMITAVIEAGSISQANNGEVPDKMVREFPPPDTVEVKEE